MTTLAPAPPDYGRLEQLYGIQTVLAQPLAVELACDAILPMVARVLRIRTAVLLDATPRRAFTWAAEGISEADVTDAQDIARKVLVYLRRDRIDWAKASRASSLRGGVAGRAAFPRHFVTLPLSRLHGHVFGVFQLEGATPFDENDLLFINAITTHLALALERQHVQLELVELYQRALAAVGGRDAMMSMVSHDLRCPLGAIQLCVDVLAADSPTLAKPVELIKGSVEVMTRLISDLRDVGSIDSGHLSIQMGSEDASRLVRDAVDGVRDAAAEALVHVETRLTPRPLRLACDRIRILQVLANLLSNALKFTPQGGHITISVDTAGPGFALFSVADTGRGIAPEDLPHVFDRYWQAKSTAHLGTGLGLAIAKGIVEAHAGTMTVTSRLGKGTTFSFTVPLDREA
jgi:signal transduction histidine kinase